MSSSIVSLLQSKKVIICGGSGGVGKTTTAAALAILCAHLGRRVMVITIDPARRLADALGLSSIHTKPTLVDPEIFARAGLDLDGSMSAMMLEAKSTWDDLIRRYAPKPEVAEKILHNPFYQSLSDTFAGSHEYLAMEKLYELHQSGEYDVLVVDTPPTKHALDFLEAPHRMGEFLDRRVVRWLVMPYLSASHKGLRLFQRTSAFIFKKLQEATGIRVIQDVSEFFFHFSELTEGNRERMRKVFEILKGPETAFVLVTTPESAALAEACYFLGRVSDYGVPFAGVLANRVHGIRYPEATDDELRSLLGAAKCPDPLLEALVAGYRRARRLAVGDELRLESFSASLPPGAFLLKVPLFAGGLEDIEGLKKMVDVLDNSEGKTMEPVIGA